MAGRHGLEALDELDAIRAFDEAKLEGGEAVSLEEALREINGAGGLGWTEGKPRSDDV